MFFSLLITWFSNVEPFIGIPSMLFNLKCLSSVPRKGVLRLAINTQLVMINSNLYTGFKVYSFSPLPSIYWDLLYS